MRIPPVVAGIIALTLCTSRPALAQGQDNASGDLAVSYSVLHDSNIKETFPTGIVLALGADVNKVIRIVGEFGGNYKTINVATATNISLQVLTYHGGIRFATSGKAPVKPFVQVLAGGARMTDILLGSGSSVSDNGWAMQGGGGVDFRAAHRVDVRLQVDYRGIRSGGSTASTGRLDRGRPIDLVKRVLRIGADGHVADAVGGVERHDGQHPHAAETRDLISR